MLSGDIHKVNNHDLQKFAMFDNIPKTKNLANPVFAGLSSDLKFFE
jgi:hypothetical protein